MKLKEAKQSAFLVVGLATEVLILAIKKRNMKRTEKFLWKIVDGCYKRSPEK